MTSPELTGVLLADTLTCTPDSGRLTVTGVTAARNVEV